MPVCKSCGNTISLFDCIDGRCSKCHFAHKNREQEITTAAAAIDDADLSTIILSTEAAPDLQIARRIDVITAEFAVGMGLLTDVFNAWRDVFGGRSQSYQNTLKDARKAVLLELRHEAHLIGADAVLGVALDYSEISGGGKSMMFLVASGTAVQLAKAA